MKNNSIPSYFIETQFDAWLNGASNGISGKFSEHAKKHGRCELKHFENVHEYSMYRYFNDLDNIGADVASMLDIDLQ